MQKLLPYLYSAAFYLLALAAQMSGYTSHSDAVILAVIATLLLIVAILHDIKKRMEPSHLILGGAIGIFLFAGIMLAGMVWQQFWPPSTTNVTVTASGAIADRKMYTAYDIEYRQKAIDEIYSFLETDMKNVNEEGVVLVATIRPRIKNGSPTDPLIEYSNKAETTFNALQNLGKKYDRFPDIAETVQVTNWNYYEIVASSRNLAAELNKRANMRPEAVMDYMENNSRLLDFEAAVPHLSAWIEERETKLKQLRNKYENAAVYPSK